MKQVTGSNNPSVPQRVSIQQPLDGHSFSASALPEAAPDEGIVCELLTAKTLLVPAEEFDPQAAGALLAAAGMAPDATESAVWSEPEGEAVGVMAFDRTAIEALRTRYADALHFATPLLGRFEPSVPAVLLDKRGGILYIKVYDRSLRLAEVVPAASEEDRLYVMESLNRVYALRSYEAQPAGTFSASERKLLRRYFKRVRS